MNLNESIAAKVQSRNYIKEKYLVLNAESWIWKKINKKPEFLSPLKVLSETLNAVGRIRQENNSDSIEGKNPWSEAWLVK